MPRVRVCGPLLPDLDVQGAGTSALVRALVAATRPFTQVELAALVGVSQPRVSQVLSRLTLSLAVTSTADGYVGRRDQLINLLCRQAPRISSWRSGARPSMKSLTGSSPSLSR